jgi:hypothetical protein
MAVVLFLLAAIGGVVVADLLLENPTVGEATVFNQPVSGYRQGELLAMGAALGFVVAVLLVASVSSTQRRRARRKQLRAFHAGTQRHAAAPARDQAGLLDAWFGRHGPVGELGERAPPTDLGRERSGGGTDDRPVTGTPGPTEHHPGSFHQPTRRAAHLHNHPDLGFPPSHQHAPNGGTPPRSGGDDGGAPAAGGQAVPAHELADAPLEALGLTSSDAAALQQALGIGTVRELAEYRLVRRAQAIVNLAGPDQ